MPRRGPSSSLAISLPVPGDDDSNVTLWATCARVFAPTARMDWEVSHWKVTLHLVNGVWVAETAVVIGAEP